jgi:hypothetical protein
MKYFKYLIFCIFLVVQSCVEKNSDDSNEAGVCFGSHELLELVEFKQGEGQVIKQAVYRVTGEHSHQVEWFLVNTFGMGKLKFACCGWDPENGKSGEITCRKLEKMQDHHLAVEMYASAEINDSNDSTYLELDRNNIDYFFVLVSLLKI